MSSRVQEGIDFGTGHFVGPLLGDPTFEYDLGAVSQANLIGYANGCPVARELTDPENSDPGRGPENMINRYGELNFWFGHITSVVEEENPDLFNELTKVVPRLGGEVASGYEDISVPDDYLTEMSPMGTLVGHALPRIFIKQLGGSEQPLEQAQGRLDRGLRIVENATTSARTPAHFLALIAEGVSQADATRQDVLTEALSAGWLKREGSVTMAEEVKQAIEAYAPEVWDAYSQMSDSEKAKNKIA